MPAPIKHTISAGGVVIGPRNAILVVNQRGQSWSLPKGHVEAGESDRDAAAREIYEESGVSDLVYIRDLGSYDRYKLTQENTDDISELKTIVLYLYRSNQIILSPKDPHNPVARWVPLHDVADLLSHPKDKEFFKSVQDSLI